MNNIIQTIQHTARAAAVLLIALCAAQTAWAQDTIEGLTYNNDGGYYEIGDADALNALATYVNGDGETSGKTFKLTDDITVTGGSDTESNYTPIGIYDDSNDRYFRGHFDGQGHTISGIRIYKGGDHYQGIFGQTGDGADIHDLTLADARITGHDYTGGIVGNNRGTVARCHVAGDVAVCAVQSYAYWHGGIVGYNEGGTIEQCTSAATLTIADADNSYCYGGIAGYNNGTLRDNLAIGATVPAAYESSYGAITGRNGGTLQRNYYTACNVANVENATGVGCEHADVTADGGAVSIHTLTLAEGITTSTPVTVSIGSTGYYAQGTDIALSYSGTPTGDTPAGYQYGYTASASTINGSTLTMPAANVTVSVNTAVLISTHEAVEVSYVDAGGTPQTAQAIALDGTETALAASGNETWYFVGTNIAFDHRLTLDGDVHLILADGCTMNITTTGDNNCIYASGRSLHIYGQAEGSGALNTETQGDYNVIYIWDGTLGIHGGNVTATVGVTNTNLAAIYVARGTAGDALVIDRGTLTADGNNGYGISIWGGDARINGGQVTADGNNGYGISIWGGDARINGGQVTASGAKAGIFVMKYDTAFPATLTLSGGTLTASSFDTQSGEDWAGTIAVAPSHTYTDGSNIYDSTTETATLEALGGKTLQLSGITLTANQAPDGNYWTTYYNSALGFTIDADEHACAYTATYGAGQLTLHNLGKEIPAGTAVIIVADNSVVSMATATDLPAYSGPTNDLRGVDVDTPVANICSSLGDGTLYVLGMTTVDNEKHFGFHRYTGTDMAAHKAFVHVASSPAQSARSLTMVFDDATAIQGLTPAAAPQPQAADHWFTLDGRRLQAKPTKKGLYIYKGRKVVLK